VTLYKPNRIKVHTKIYYYITSVF